MNTSPWCCVITALLCLTLPSSFQLLLDRMAFQKYIIFPDLTLHIYICCFPSEAQIAWTRFALAVKFLISPFDREPPAGSRGVFPFPFYPESENVCNLPMASP